MTIRGDIKKIITVNTADDAAVKICEFLNDEIGGLAGNGWFDDDPVMRAKFFKDDEDEEDEA